MGHNLFFKKRASLGPIDLLGPINSTRWVIFSFVLVQYQNIGFPFSSQDTLFNFPYPSPFSETLYSSSSSLSFDFFNSKAFYSNFKLPVKRASIGGRSSQLQPLQTRLTGDES